MRAYLGRTWFQYVITVCPESERVCPRIFLGATHYLHWPVTDPATVPEGNEALAAFRAARDQLRQAAAAWIDTLPAPNLAAAGQALRA